MPLTDAQIDELRGLDVPDSGNRVGPALKLLGLTQQQAADGLGESQPYISDVVRGRYQTITLAKAQKIAAFLGCPIDVLFPVRAEVA